MVDGSRSEIGGRRYARIGATPARGNVAGDGGETNLLWLFCDQLRYHALACNGDRNVATPNLDRLAGGGVRCTHAVSHYPVCMPFRAGLVTGQYAHVHGLRVQGDLFPPQSRTIAHAFRQAGYRTSWVGKWHLAGEHQDFWVDPQLRGGFEDWYGFNVSNNYYRSYYCHGDEAEPIPLEGYQTDALTELSLRYLDEVSRSSGQPWFHCLSVEAPHHGIGRDGRDGQPAPPEYEARFTPATVELRGNVPPHLEPQGRTKLAGYYAMIANLDHNVGRVLDWLEESGLAESTLVAFFSDHGELGGSHGHFGKYRPYDESIRIPLLLRLPGTLPTGEVHEGVVSGIDLFATCAGLCGVPLFAGQQGVDHTPALRGDTGAVRDAALVQWLGRRARPGTTVIRTAQSVPAATPTVWDPTSPSACCSTTRKTSCNATTCSDSARRPHSRQRCTGACATRHAERRAAAGLSDRPGGVDMIRVTKPEGFGNIRLQEAPIPEIGARQVLVRTEATLISRGSELFRRYIKQKEVPQRIMGYSLAGSIERVGAAVTEYLRTVTSHVSALLPISGADTCVQWRTGAIKSDRTHLDLTLKTV